MITVQAILKEQDIVRVILVDRYNNQYLLNFTLDENLDKAIVRAAIVEKVKELRSLNRKYEQVKTLEGEIFGDA